MSLRSYYFHSYSTKQGFTAVGTQGQLQQVMNHKDAGIFQVYINERIQCDVQAAFLGRPSADAILKSVSHMSRGVDPRAPTNLTNNEVNSLKTHPLVVELRDWRQFGVDRYGVDLDGEMEATNRSKEGCLDGITERFGKQGQ